MTVETDGDVAELVRIRREIHAHPELAFSEHRTAATVAGFLRNIGAEVHEGIAGTGVVGILRAGGSARSIGLRADMDALPIREESGLPYTSRNSGIFHGCGHDGHVAMLLGAAQRLAKTRNFDGTVNLIFQPAEEGEGGGRAMVEQGLFERFPCDRIFALHNWPDLPVGTIATRAGAIMAAADRFEIRLSGRGGHAALPHDTPDIILAAAALVTQLNTIVSRDIPAYRSAVLTVTQIHGGETHNVMPASVTIGGTVRSFDAGVQDRIETRLRTIAQGIAHAFGIGADIAYDRYYPAVINDADAFAEAMVAAATVGTAIEAPEPALTSEDFAFMTNACKGAYVWLGQGSGAGGRPLHHPEYDFNDDVLSIGVELHVALAQLLLKKACAG